jgi:hypothetical protein
LWRCNGGFGPCTTQSHLRAQQFESGTWNRVEWLPVRCETNRLVAASLFISQSTLYWNFMYHSRTVLSVGGSAWYLVRHLRCTLTIDSVLANSKTQNTFLFPVHGETCKYTTLPSTQKKLEEILYLLICSFLLCLSWLLRSRIRKSRRDLWITLYLIQYYVPEYLHICGVAVIILRKHLQTADRGGSLAWSSDIEFWTSTVKYYVSKTFTKDLKLKGLIGVVHDRSAPVPMASDFGL